MNKIDIEIRVIELEELIASECTGNDFLDYCMEYDDLTEQLEELV